MTRTEYIAKLTKYLRKLPQKDYEEALEYFMEYFEEAGPENEAQVIAELGHLRKLLMKSSLVCLMKRLLRIRAACVIKRLSFGLLF